MKQMVLFVMFFAFSAFVVRVSVLAYQAITAETPVRRLETRCVTTIKDAKTGLGISEYYIDAEGKIYIEKIGTYDVSAYCKTVEVPQ